MHGFDPSLATAASCAQAQDGWPVTANAMEFEFRDHDGTLRSATAVPVVRTGNFVGRLQVMQAGQPYTGSLSYAWGYYYQGKLIEQTANNHHQWLNRPMGNVAATLQAVNGSYPFTLPMGTRDYPTLPAAGLTLRLWVGVPGQFVLQSGGPPSGVMATRNLPIQITETPFAVWVARPRDNHVGTTLEASVITAYPVATNTVFTLTSGGTASVALGQVMIRAGNTWSNPFAVSLSQVRGPGRVSATRVQDNLSITSAEIECGSRASEHVCQGCPTTSTPQPEQHMAYVWWEMCITHGSPGGFGTGKTECGDCASVPTAPPICNHGPADTFSVDQNQPECGIVTPWWDCQIYRRWVDVATYMVVGGVTPTTSGCADGSVNDESSTSSTGEIHGELTLPGNGSLGGSQSTTTTTASVKKNRKLADSRLCCRLEYAGQKGTYILDCRDVD
ncbi:MAG: hypothetical protein ACK595_11600 [Planctomycetota bacterium]